MKSLTWLVLATAFFIAGCSTPQESPPYQGRAAASRTKKPKPKVASTGEQLFKDHCLDCHALDGRGGKIGPDLTGIGAQQNRAYLESVTRRPSRYYVGTVMPATDKFSTSELEALIDYLSNLKSPRTVAAAEKDSRP